MGPSRTQHPFADDFFRSANDGPEEVVERCTAVRRFAPTFLAAAQPVGRHPSWCD
jgi:hypothetical protein